MISHHPYHISSSQSYHFICIYIRVEWTEDQTPETNLNLDAEPANAKTCDQGKLLSISLFFSKLHNLILEVRNYMQVNENPLVVMLLLLLPCD